MSCANELIPALLTALSVATKETTSVIDAKDASAEAAFMDELTRSENVSSVKDRATQAIINAKAGTAIPPGERVHVGDAGEAAWSVFTVSELGHEVIHQNVTPGEKGIDLITLDPKTDQIFIWEMKTSGLAGAILSDPRMGKTKDTGTQMGKEWIESRLESLGYGDIPVQDVVAMAVKIDVNTDPALGRCIEIDPITMNVISESAPFDIEDYIHDVTH